MRGLALLLATLAVAAAVPGCIKVHVPTATEAPDGTQAPAPGTKGPAGTTGPTAAPRPAATSRPTPTQAPPSPDPAAGNATAEPAVPLARTVVVATFDTGTNPFHPCFRHPGTDPREIPGLPPVATLDLTFADTYEKSLAASKAELGSIEPRTLHHVNGTRLLFYGLGGAATELVDDYPHGAQASSQIVCEEFGLAGDAWLVVLNWYDDAAGNAPLMEWAAEQAWIDVVHLNIQDTPVPLEDSRTTAIREMVENGQLVVLAAGNGVMGNSVAYPMELSAYNGPAGSLIAGANDNGGYALFTNYNPHVVMDGCGTVAAAPDSFGTDSFGGTSSASPRISGYAARLLGDLRVALGGDQRRVGDVLARWTAGPPPAAGPLADGQLTVAELHEVVRKTADPNPTDSTYDGELWLGTCNIPQPADLPVAFYPKMGYGEVSEHTLPAAMAVLLGTQPMPDRPNEDRFYEQSEALRESYWG